MRKDKPNLLNSTCPSPDAEGEVLRHASGCAAKRRSGKVENARGEIGEEGEGEGEGEGKEMSQEEEGVAGVNKEEAGGGGGAGVVVDGEGKGGSGGGGGGCHALGGREQKWCGRRRRDRGRQRTGSSGNQGGRG